MKFEILYQDEHLVVIDKPEALHVHKPSLKGVKVPEDQIIMPQLRDQLQKWVYPVHRLDVATSGCLLWALSSEAASRLSESMREGRFQKKYHAVVRGWTENHFEISSPLSSESDPSKLLEAKTKAVTKAKIEHDVSVGIRHAKARYSLTDLEAVTGRFHQLRRHMARVSHPIVGDVGHGDRHHNRYFRETLGIPGLCLRAFSLEFPHPYDTMRVTSVRANPNPKWQQIEKLFY